MCAWRVAVVTVAVALAVAPAAAAQPPPEVEPIDASWPLGQGAYTTPLEPGWVYFRTPSIKGSPRIGCGIGPDGTIGCDFVPHPPPGYPTPPVTIVPPGTNQTFATATDAATYRYSDTQTFTREVDDLPEGHRVANGNASCAYGFQGTIHCENAEHGFLIVDLYGFTW